MAEFDAWLRTTLPCNILAPTFVLLILFLILRKRMGSLKDKFFAHLTNRMIAGMNKKIGGKKEELFGPLWDLKGDKPDLTLLELGPGGGANFKFYPRGTSIICVDPNPHFESYLQNNVSQFPHVTLKEFIVAKGEDMAEVPGNYCDAVVCSCVLCSVEDIDKLLTEVKRVLKPGGMFFYLEHIPADPSSWLYSLQCFVNPLWKTLAQGCSLTKESWRNIEQAGFSNTEYRRCTLPSTMWISPLRNLLAGTATK